MWGDNAWQALPEEQDAGIYCKYNHKKAKYILKCINFNYFWTVLIGVTFTFNTS